MAERPPIPRVVNPRKTGYTHLPLAVIDLDLDVALWEPTFTRTGEVLTAESMAKRLMAVPPCIVVCPDTPRLLLYLDELHGTHPQWQYRVTPLKSQVMRSNGELSKWSVGHTLVNFFGWTRANNHQAHRYHYPIDPELFCRSTIGELLPPGDLDNADRPMRLFSWGQDLRSWCEAQDLKVTPTAGGLAAQLLKDPRFFPKPRRKVPRATNERVRPKLPGNFYRLYADVDTPYQAEYLDMSASHHTIASTLAFPDPDHLVARGWFDVSDVPGVTVTDGRPWVKSGTRAFKRVTEQSHGLLYVKLSVPVIREERFPPPYLRNPGERMAWIYTNEVPMIRALGGRIEWVTAAWTSFETAPGLNQYARFALQELATSSDARKRWLKPTLLSAYGLLAARPRPLEIAHKRSLRGQERMYPAGSGLIRAMAMIQEGDREAPLVNVLYRGLIEAEQRLRALDLARYLHGFGHRVLAIYADSVFVESGPPLPFLPDGWRVDQHLEGLFFSSATHFTSRQLTKLPGVAKDSSQRVQLIAGMRGELHVGADLSKKGLAKNWTPWTKGPRSSPFDPEL